ncbi:unnamed protein product [Leptosia nina]|uniref:Uncharacterized protein n=1 Tax=Leptosia nina TaxID=320188 RepID=A0AAV1J7Y1_9NEOP
MLIEEVGASGCGGANDSNVVLDTSFHRQEFRMKVYNTKIGGANEKANGDANREASRRVSVPVGDCFVAR